MTKTTMTKRAGGTTSVVATALLAGALTVGCAAETGTGWAPPDTDAIARADVERVVSTLAADSMLGRFARTGDAMRAARYLAREFEAAGLQPIAGEDDYLQDFTVDSVALANVAGMIPGRRSDEFVLFSAHYDHIGIRPGMEGDSIANGANDNASGVAAVVALADYFAGRGTPERTLLFVGFTAEETGGHGSRYFSEQLDPDRIVAMFNIEMIGKPAVEGPNSAWITGFERSSFGPLLQEAVEGTVFSFHPDPYPGQNLFYRSDNATLARLGVPAHTISTTPIDVDPDYHRVTDQVETLDLDHMTNTVRAIATGAETIVTGEVAPTRVDPATVGGGG